MAANKHTVKAGYIVPHPSLRRESLDVVGFTQEQEVYTDAYLESVTPVHQLPRKWFELLAWWWLMAVRTVVHLLAGTFGGRRAIERQLGRRAQMLNCDGQATAMSAVLVGHVRFMLLNAPDNGWLHTLAMEVDCMRCQYAAWAELVQPALFERLFDLLLTANLLTQCCLVYCLAPSVIHAYQVYRVEEDMWLSTMLTMLQQPGRLPAWEYAPPPAAAQAYHATPNTTAGLRGMLLRMRADEASIRHINRQLAGGTPGTPTDTVAVRQFDN